MSNPSPSNDQINSALKAEEEAIHYYGLEFKEHRVRVPDHDLNLRVLESGSGRPLILVPGGGGESLPMLPFMAVLSGYRIFMVTRPGAPGCSSIDYREIHVRSVATSCLSALLDAFEIEQADFVANSMGGLWTFWLALDAPQRVNTIIQGGCPALLLDTSAPFPMRLAAAPLIGDLLFPLVQPKDADAAVNELRMMGSSEETMERIPDVLAQARYRVSRLPSYRKSWHSILKTTLRLTGSNPRYRLRANELQQIEQPVLFIWGENDPFGGLSVGRQAVEHMPDARLEPIEAGHIPFLDRAGLCAEQTDVFLSGMH